ncbi:g7397 [Coccomyxa elongata]
MGKEVPAGPFPLVFACLTLFLIETPAMQHFSIFGVRLTEKIFTQAAALQLILSSPRSALLLIAGGTLLGVLQHLNFMGMREWKVPGAVSGRLGGMLAPLLQGDRQGHRTMVRAPQGGSRAAPAPPQRPLGQRLAAARPPSVAASREGMEQLVAMGFSEPAARSALERSNNDVQAATSLLL